MSKIELQIKPETAPMPWEEFCKTHPPFSVGVDGYIDAGPKFDADAPHANFDHHHGVSRLETRATCGQALIAVRMGLFQCFRDKCGPRMTVYANDCDQDVCTAWTILKHHYLADQTMNPALNRLVSIEDMLDTTAGAYPFPADLPIMEEFAWVYEPYTQCRLAGGLEKRDAGAFKSVVSDVENRILQHVAGKGESLPVDTRYEQVGGGKGWAMVHELGAQARTGMFADGIRAFLSVKERKDGKWSYVIGRMSEYIKFPILRMLDTLNQAEGAEKDRWGGATTIAGSPRIGGSKLTPDEVSRIINDSLPKTE
ncbi:MAG: hypothetical protein Q7R81_05310 [Candidatus Peregrinibacteria bacterium]|nr:hypothetical protein [Candidatus Peregrinibacteria bacterium]